MLGTPSPAARLSLALCLTIALPACGEALSTGDPATSTLEIDQPFMDGQTTVRDVNAVLADVDDPDDATGDRSRWSVVDWDFGPDLELVRWSFESNYRLALTIQRTEDADNGRHELLLTIRNNFGTFVARGEFFVFR
jgi:hypothetical protein